jgi:hypothetical protein
MDGMSLTSRYPVLREHAPRPANAAGIKQKSAPGGR